MDVCLIERRAETVERIATHGLRISGVRGEHVVSLPAFRRARDAGPVDLAIVCVKAYDTEAAVVEHAALWEGGAAALSLQNGVGNWEKIAARIGVERTLAGTTTHGARFVEPGVVEHTGEGDTVIGEAAGGGSARAKQFAAALSQAGLATEPVDDIQSALWSKLCVNAAINPVAALLRQPNGALAEHAELRPLLGGIIKETVAVAVRIGVRLDPARMLARTERVIARTANNRVSMLADLEAGRRTEIDSINGEIARLGDLHGVLTPLNDAMARLVRAAERGR
jgi:2-dehydropantoate 2-reductase